MWIDSERLIHSFKTGLACLAGFALTKALHNYLFFDQWLIVTILVVMCAQLSVGSIFYKSTVRFIGTCLGSLLAAATLVSFSGDPLVFALVIALAGMICSYIATGQQSYSDAGTLGAVTTAIILINPSPTLALTFERFFEITLGIIIATLISQFILPIHARKHLRRSQGLALNLLGEYYRSVVTEPQIEREKMNELDSEIVDSLRTQHKLANEAKRELLGSRFEPQVFQKTMEGEKYILRGIAFLSQVYHEFSVHLPPESKPAWHNFNQDMIAVFNDLAKKIEDPSLLIKIPALPSSNLENSEEPRTLHAVFFCLENILMQLKELAS